VDNVLEGLGLKNQPRIAIPAGSSLYDPPHQEDDPSNSQSFSLASGTPLDSPVGFVVGSVLVDNNTSAFLTIVDATADGIGRSVPPGTGAALPILGHISRARAVWTAPPGKVQPPFIAGEAAQLTFLASPVPLGFGLAQSVPPVLGASAVAFPALSRAVGTYTFDVPEQHFARGMVIFLANQGGAGSVGVGYHERDATTGVDNNILSSVNIAAGGTTTIKIYPGIVDVANQTANNAIVAVPRIVMAVITGPCICVCSYVLLP
jgi:hypothetical protein